MELEELLVRGGYIDPEEVLASDMIPETQEQKMDRAAQVFYQHVSNYNTEFMSPQYESIFEAGNAETAAEK